MMQAINDSASEGHSQIWRMLLYVLYVVAAPAYSDSLPEVLKDMHRAGDTCPKEEAAAESMVFPTGAGVMGADLSCAITASQLSGVRGGPNVVLVDVRRADDFAALHIDGALSAGISELRTKNFLRSKTVILIGSGKAERDLYEACTALKAGGFRQVKVLRGGLLSWLASGQTVVGFAPDEIRSANLSPSELWTESRFDANLVLVTQARRDLQAILPSSVTIADESPASINATMARLRKKRPDKAVAAVVLVTTPSFGFQDQQQLRRALEPVPLLIYTHSTDEYRRQLVQQKASWLAQARGPKRPNCGL